MIIVSQDKEHIINFDNIKEVRIGHNGSLKVDIFADYEVTLGDYGTKQRAKEILQEIVEAIKGKSKITMTTEELITEASGGFYEMPED